jgi:hypothetical protein
MLFDHREAPGDTEPSDEASLREGLAYTYGDSADVNGGWVALDRIVAEFWDPDTEPQDARRYYLNQITHATDSWLSSPEWTARLNVERIVADGEAITVGFDGSTGRRKGKADATALIGVTLTDGHMFELGVWEQPSGPAGIDWEVPISQVEAAVRTTFASYNVVGFYADPAGWSEHVASWSATYGAKLKVKASNDHPVSWKTNRMGLVVEALEQLHGAIVQGEMTHSGESDLTRHMLNARRRQSRSGIFIAKEFPDSVNKIDSAYAGMLAWRARLDALAKGVKTGPAFIPRRIR